MATDSTAGLHCVGDSIVLGFTNVLRPQDDREVFVYVIVEQEHRNVQAHRLVTIDAEILKQQSTT